MIGEALHQLNETAVAGQHIVCVHQLEGLSQVLRDQQAVECVVVMPFQGGNPPLRERR
jgi:hypothetical protein